MSTEDSQETLLPQVADAPVAQKTDTKPAGGIIWLVLLLSLISLGLGGYTWFELTTLRSDTTFAEQLSQRDTRIDQLQQRTQSLGALISGIQTDISGLEQAQTANAETLRRLAGSIAVDNLDLAVAEIEQLLIMAVHNLTLQRDVNIALAALEAAGQRLAALDIPDLQPTRAQLNADISALKSVSVVDTPGLSLYLADLSSRVTRLPLKRTTAADEPAPAETAVTGTVRPAWQQLLLEVWGEFKSMFIVTRTGDGATATLLPDETWFLYQNLRLQLETARLAVIRNDTQTLRSALQQVSAWLRDYFDAADSDVMNILQALEKMAAVDLAPELPDVSSSLETLHVFIKSRARADTVTEPGTL